VSWLQKAVLLLKSTHKADQEELSLPQLKEWLQQCSKEIVEQNNLLLSVQEHARIMEDQRWALEAQLDLWQKKTRLHPTANEVIPFFRETRHILDLLHFSNQPALGEVLAVNQELEKRLHDLIQKIEASSFLHDFSFMADEAVHAEINPLLSKLLNLDAVRKKLDLKITESKYHNLQLIDSKTEYLRVIHAHLLQLTQELDAKKSRLAAAQQKKEEKEKSLQQLRGDQKNLDLGELIKRKKEVEKGLEEREMEILSFFSKIKSLLQQYQEKEPSNALLFSYIKDPLSSFFQDEGLFITELLEKIAELLRQSKFYLNQDDLLSSLSALEGIYSQRLRSIKVEYKELQKELKEISEQIQHNFFVVKMDDAAYRLEHYSKQEKKMTEDISTLEKKSAKLHDLLKREREEIQGLVKAGFSKNVLLVLEQKK